MQLIPRPPDSLASSPLQRIRQLGYNVHFAFVLQLLDRRDAGEVDPDDVERIITILESLFVRRKAAGWPTNLLHRLFDRLCAARIGGVQDLLPFIHPHFPSDARFRRDLLEGPIYRRSHSTTMLILQRIEGDLGHLESHLDPDASVEHVMPQTIGDDSFGRAWQAMLGPDWEVVHERWLHTLGNLTVTRYNSNMSNRPFVNPSPGATKDKRTWLGESHFEMNRRISANSVWTAEEIEHRGIDMAERGLRLWPLPDGESGV